MELVNADAEVEAAVNGLAVFAVDVGSPNAGVDTVLGGFALPKMFGDAPDIVVVGRDGKADFASVWIEGGANIDVPAVVGAENVGKLGAGFSDFVVGGVGNFGKIRDCTELGVTVGAEKAFGGSVADVEADVEIGVAVEGVSFLANENPLGLLATFPKADVTSGFGMEASPVSWPAPKLNCSEVRFLLGLNDETIGFSACFPVNTLLAS